jgi:hypothetical protein
MEICRSSDKKPAFFQGFFHCMVQIAEETQPFFLGRKFASNWAAFFWR